MTRDTKNFLFHQEIYHKTDRQNKWLADDTTFCSYIQKIQKYADIHNTRVRLHRNFLNLVLKQSSSIVTLLTVFSLFPICTHMNIHIHRTKQNDGLLLQSQVEDSRINVDFPYYSLRTRYLVLVIVQGLATVFLVLVYGLAMHFSYKWRLL